MTQLKALIDPLTELQTQDVRGWRVCQRELEDAVFTVADPYFWVDCDEVVTPETHVWSPDLQQFMVIPEPEPTTSSATTAVGLESF